MRDSWLCRRRPGRAVTLIEMLIVVGIIGILTSIMVGAATLIQNQSNEQVTKSTIGLLVAALRQFHDYGYRYNEDGGHAGFSFPLDCNDRAPGTNRLERTLAMEFRWLPGAVAIERVFAGDSIVHQPEYSGSEGMYFFLSRVAESREILGKIDDALITNADDNGYAMQLKIGSERYPLLRVIDRWGQTLQYDYYDEKEPDPVTRYSTRRAFPLIKSAGPDRIFGTHDDISSEGM